MQACRQLGERRKKEGGRTERKLCKTRRNTAHRSTVSSSECGRHDKERLLIEKRQNYRTRDVLTREYKRRVKRQDKTLLFGWWIGWKISHNPHYDIIPLLRTLSPR